MLRQRVTEILTITDDACHEHLDGEYAQLARELTARLARKRPSPLTRAKTTICAAGAIYAIGRLNFLLDPSQHPHLSADELATHLGVTTTTMANKATLIEKALDLKPFEPDLMRTAMLERHPMARMVEVNGILADARTLPPEIQDEACRQGLIPDLDARRTA